MVLDEAGKLAAVQLALYSILILPSILSLWKHGWQGVVGWGYLFAFCSLRIIGSGLQISNEEHDSTSTSAQIISGVGLSPLVLAFIGILYESNHHVRGTKPFAQTLIPTVILHLVVGAALGLVVVGYQPDQKYGRTLQKVGYIFFVIIWVIITAFTAVSWTIRHLGSSSKRLLIAITLGLPFLGVRVLYSLIAAFDTKINSFTGPIAYRVCLAVLMELIIVIILSVFGVVTGYLR